MIFWLVLKLEISYNRVMISWRILVSFRGFFEDYIFAWWNIWVSIILLLPYDKFKCKWQGHSVTHPLFLLCARVGAFIIALCWFCATCSFPSSSFLCVWRDLAFLICIFLLCHLLVSLFCRCCLQEVEDTITLLQYNAQTCEVPKEEKSPCLA